MFCHKSAKKYEKSKNSFQPEKPLKTFLIVTRIITNMLYYTGKPTDLIESSTTISIYLEKLPWAFVFFPKNAIKLTSQNNKYSEFILLNDLDCSDTIFRNTRPTLECLFLNISWQLIEISNKMSRRDGKKTTKNTCKQTNLTFIKPEVDVSCCITSFSRPLDIRVLFSKTV